MNDSPDHFSQDKADQVLDDLLSPLKSLSPPLESQLASRAAVAKELSRLAAKAEVRSLPWWRQSISVPLPMAAGLAALLMVSFLNPGWSPRNLREKVDVQRSADLQPTSTPPADKRQLVRPSSSTPASVEPAWSPGMESPGMEYYQTEVYLCGLGRLSSEAGYVLREQ